MPNRPLAQVSTDTLFQLAARYLGEANAANQAGDAEAEKGLRAKEAEVIAELERRPRFRWPRRELGPENSTAR
jgi:hypothetical protein